MLHPCKFALRKNVPSFPLYSVDNYGECRSLRTNKKLAYSINHLGYYSVRFCDDRREKRYLLHRLVLSTFTGFNTEKKNVDHKDDNPANNELPNLRWVTQSENVKKSFATGRAKPNMAMLGRSGAKHGASKQVVGYNANGEEVIRFESISLARIGGYNLNFYTRGNGTVCNCKGLKFIRI